MPSLNTVKTDASKTQESGKFVEIPIKREITFDFNQNELKVLNLELSNSSPKPRIVPSIKWEKGDVFALYYCFKNTNGDKFMYRRTKEEFQDKTLGSDLTLEIDSVSKDGKTGIGTIRGNIKIDEAYLTADKKSFKNPNNWYFGAYLCGKQDPKTKKITNALSTKATVTETRTDDYMTTGISFNTSDKMIAISDNARELQMDIPICIPFNKIQFVDGKIEPLKIKDFTVKPLGSIINFVLRNDFANAIAINTGNTNYKIKVDGGFSFGTTVNFNYEADLKDVGTDNYNSGYSIVSSGSSIKELPIDWSNYTGVTKGNYAILNSGDKINLFVWTVYENKPSETPIKVDFSGLDLLMAAQEPSGYYDSRADFVKPYMLNNLPLGQVRLYGGVNDDTGTNNISDNDGIKINYFSTNTNPIKLKEGCFYTLNLSIHGDIMITEVYFSWKAGKNNRGVIELFNPNNYNIPLNDYYLARVRYNDKGGNINSVNNGRIQFRSTWGNDDKRLQYALLMPLDLSTENQLRINDMLSEITPAGFDIKTTKFYDSYLKRVSSDENKCYRVKTALFCPSNSSQNPKNKAFNYIPSGWTFCFGGVGVYEMVENNSQDLLKSDELGQAALFSYANYIGNSVPAQFTHIWGVVDGIFDKVSSAPTVKYNKYASANDSEAGVMARDINQGWVLVKKIGDKFYVLDTFGPSVIGQNSIEVMTPENFKNFMSGLKSQTDPNDNRNWSIRKQSAILPNGGFFYGGEWNFTIDIGFSNIGARTKYCNGNTRPNSVPYFLGNKGNSDAEILPTTYK